MLELTPNLGNEYLKHPVSEWPNLIIAAKASEEFETVVAHMQTCYPKFPFFLCPFEARYQFDSDNILTDYSAIVDGAKRVLTVRSENLPESQECLDAICDALEIKEGQEGIGATITLESEDPLTVVTYPRAKNQTEFIDSFVMLAAYETVLAQKFRARQSGAVNLGQTLKFLSRDANEETLKKAIVNSEAWLNFVPLNLDLYTFTREARPAIPEGYTSGIIFYSLFNSLTDLVGKFERFARRKSPKPKQLAKLHKELDGLRSAANLTGRETSKLISFLCGVIKNNPGAILKLKK
jgi:hypothetical protein